jgi:hypothetical protein
MATTGRFSPNSSTLSTTLEGGSRSTSGVKNHLLRIERRVEELHGRQTTIAKLLNENADDTADRMSALEERLMKTLTALEVSPLLFSVMLALTFFRKISRTGLKISRDKMRNSVNNYLK